MTQPANTPPPQRRRRRRLWLAVALAAALAVGIPVGQRVWLWLHVPEPPDVVVVDAGSGVAEDVAEARARVKQHPLSAAAWGHLGLVLHLYSFSPEAVACYAQAEVLEPGNPRWPYLQGLIRSTSDPESSLPFLERAVRLGGTVPTPRLRLGEVLLRCGRPDEAEEHFLRVLEREPANPRALLGLGQVASDRDDLAASLENLQRSANGAPRVKATHLLLAEVHQRRGDTVAAAAERRLAAGLPDAASWPDPYREVVEGVRSEPARIGQARMLRQQGRNPEALTVLQGALRDYPEAYRVRLELGRVNLSLGDANAAEQAYREAVRLKPDSAEAHFEWGMALRTQGDVVAAAARFRHALQLKPRDGEAFYHLGVCLEQQGDDDGAREAYRAAVREQPDLAAGHKALGLLLARHGQVVEAVLALEHALDLEPADATARVGLEKVRQRINASLPKQ
jgi:tetratricopeptide (TPR) repeat protein